jgi:hypothetical protein
MDMSTGPGWAAAWPGSVSCSGQAGLSVVSVVSVVISISFL